MNPRPGGPLLSVSPETSPFAADGARILDSVARSTGLRPDAVKSVVDLLDQGNTVPFISRYRKEATGGLDDVAVVGIQDALTRIRELESRREVVLQSIASQQKLTPDLEKAIRAAETRSALEDLYLPHRPKRRTRASIARERGLEPLADRIYAQMETSGDPERIAGEFVDPQKDVPTASDALKGARDIVAERVAETAELRDEIRTLFKRRADLISKAARGKADERSKFEDYYDFRQPARNVPSHRLLAIRRGESEGYLGFRIAPEAEQAKSLLHRRLLSKRESIWRAQMISAIDDGYDRLLSLQIEAELRLDLKQWADGEAVEVFAANLKDLLLAAPFGNRPVLAVDPGLRTGCKLAVLDGTGKLLEHGVVYPTKPRRDIAGTTAALDRIFERHPVEAIAVGNGTGGRESEQVMRDYLRDRGRNAVVVSVNESGASVYSASEQARRELPGQDVTVRGTVSIGRRLQDPLAELVKIDPKAIGVGQYQHDVDQRLLKQKLDTVVESCVNAVGVDVNTASAALLGYVAGVGPGLAEAIVAHRDAHGGFESRADLLEVPRFGAKTFEQAAGFLRIKGRNPLDDSAVHPERYALVERMAEDIGCQLVDLIGNNEIIQSIDSRSYICDNVGRFTLDDILAELEKPGRDPRRDFEAVAFRGDVNSLADLEEGMILAGIVTNVTHFGAFVDIGVHQDGLVHVSEIADRFVRNPADVLNVGQKVTARVLDVDRQRERIGLSLKRLITRASGFEGEEVSGNG